MRATHNMALQATRPFLKSSRRKYVRENSAHILRVIQLSSDTRIASYSSSPEVSQINREKSAETCLKSLYG